MIGSRWLFALMLTAALPSFALAQDQSSDQQTQSDQADQSQTQQAEAAPESSDPVEALQGLWHVDHVEGGAANDATSGSILKIDRQAIASLTGGTCSSPSLVSNPDAADPKQAGVDITCLGQLIATARWNTDDPDTVNWNEPNLAVVLHRVKTPASAQKPADDSSGSDDNAQ